MNKTTNESNSVINVALFATLLITGACSKQDPAQDLNKMQAITVERAATPEEVAKAQALAAAAPAPATAYGSSSKAENHKDKPSTIAGLNEAIDLGKYLGAEGAVGTRVAKAVWNILEKNQATVDLSSQRLSILPTDARIRERVAGWRRPVTRGFTVTLKNVYGMEVVRYDYAISYSYGGHADGVGRYLSNLNVIHSDLSIMWGFNIDAQFVTGSIENTGTVDNPVVAITGEVRWKVKNVFTNVRKSNAFWVSGDGSFQRLNRSEREDVVAVAN